MVEIALDGKRKKILTILFGIATFFSFICMLTFVQKFIYNFAFVKILHSSGSFEYWRQILLHISFISTAMFALGFLLVSRSNSLKVTSSNVFATVILLSFALAQIVMIFDRWNMGINDSRYDFGDFFTAASCSIQMGEDICPPVSMLIYQIARNTFPGLNGNPWADYSIMMDSFVAGYYIQLFFIFSLAPLAIIIYKNINGTGLQKAFFTVAIFLSRPFMIGFQRGNSVMQALICVMIFVMCYQSKDKLIKEIALLALALAFCFKIYTAVFGVLLLKEKDIKSAVRCAVYALALFVLPVFCHTTGVESMILYIKALFGYVSETTLPSQLSIGGILKLLCKNLGAESAYSVIFPIAMLIFVAGCAFIIIKSKKKWQIYFACAAACVMIPTLSWPYTAIYFSIAIIAMLNDKNKGWNEYFVLVCFMFVFTFNYYKLCRLTEIIFGVGTWGVYLLVAFIAVVADCFLQLKAEKAVKNSK